MNKKLLFAAMSLAALTACTDNDFESQKVAQQEATPVTFEVINNNDAFTRASMNGNKVAWSATDGDLFTLYHGAAALGDVTGYQNATYTAGAAEGSPAVLTTPSMILQGAAIMVWPADTAFRYETEDGAKLMIKVPEKQPADIENYIPYVSEQIMIGAYDGVKALPNTAGYQREYPIYMRPMASQLNLKTDYAGTDAAIAQLYEGGSACPADGGIEPISLTSVDLVADEGNAKLTQKIAVTFTDPTVAIKKQWDDAVKNNAWGKITDFDKTSVTQKEMLTTECIQGLDGCKFLILPLKADLAGTEKSAVIVNTRYGKVIVAKNTFTNSKYSDDEIGDAWYRYVSATATIDALETKAATAGSDGKFKTTADIAGGMKQTLNGFSAYTATSGIVKGEPIGAAATRYVKVLLNHLDMSDLHIKTDKQLRDVAYVWNHLKVGNVTIKLDGDKDKGEIEISQKTIKLINDLNAAAAKEETPRKLTVMPCDVAGEVCKTIVITGASDIQNIQDLTFILINGAAQADVALKADETWKWEGTTATAKQIKVGTGVKGIINRGTLVNAATATLAIYDIDNNQLTTVPFRNEGTWNITGGDLNVQFDVTNVGTVNIAAGAEYHQDGAGNDFINDSETLPTRFLAAGKTEKIGLVNNSGVFASAHDGHINNYGLIEHLDNNAKTYIWANNDGGTGFSATFADDNRIGRINLPFSNKDEENVSIKNGAATGFVSVTVSTEAGAPNNGKLDLSSVGDYVNYCIIKGGVTEISKVSDKIKYVEFDAGTTEIMWNVATATYDGLIVFSPVNVKRNTKITVSESAYLKAKMYVGGETTLTKAKCNGYFGDTQANFDTMYLTY